VKVSASTSRGCWTSSTKAACRTVWAAGTCVEGDYDAVMAVIRECHQALAKDCRRIACTIKMDWREGHDNMLESKIESVEKSWGGS
jgi:uncharacterized protein YqgV (UPF0045/DUF77 family)